MIENLVVRNQLIKKIKIEIYFKMVRTKLSPEQELKNMKIKFKHVLDGEVENDKLKIENFRTIVLPSLAEPIIMNDTRKQVFVCKFDLCMERNQQFATKHSLIRHLRTVHANQIPGDGQYLAPKDTSISHDGFICSTCKRHFLRKDKFQEHCDQGCSAKPTTSTQLRDDPLFTIEEHFSDSSSIQQLSQTFSICSIKDEAFSDDSLQDRTLLLDPISDDDATTKKPRAKKRPSVMIISKRSFEERHSDEEPVPIKRARRCDDLTINLDKAIWESPTIKRTTSLTCFNKPKPFCTSFFSSQGNILMETD